MRVLSSTGLKLWFVFCFLGGGAVSGAQAQSVNENQSFKLNSPAAVWYGAASKFTVKWLPAGTHLCGNKLFGDPSYGVVKSCRTTAFLDTLTCYPAQLGGTGSRAAWGVVLSPVVQGWAGWWCGDKMQVVACVADGCKPEVAKGVIASVSDILNVQVKSFRTESVDSERLKAVWVPHLAEINAMKAP